MKCFQNQSRTLFLFEGGLHKILKSKKTAFVVKRTKDSINSTSTEIFRSNKIATNVTEPIRSQVNDDVEDNESIMTSRFLNINDHTILSPRVPEIILEKPLPAPRVEGRESWQQMTQKSDFSKKSLLFFKSTAFQI